MTVPRSGVELGAGTSWSVPSEPGTSTRKAPWFAQSLPSFSKGQRTGLYFCARVPAAQSLGSHDGDSIVDAAKSEVARRREVVVMASSYSSLMYRASEGTPSEESTKSM